MEVQREVQRRLRVRLSTGPVVLKQLISELIVDGDITSYDVRCAVLLLQTANIIDMSLQNVVSLRT